MSSRPFKIHDTVIAPGEHKTVDLQVSRLPSGTSIDINAMVWRSTEPGETMLICGGVHGDEINGIEIVRRAVAEGIFDNLLKGSIIAVPLLNVYGFINFSREVPDGKDVNRSFPGLAHGSLASRVAYLMTQEIFPLIDCGLDFHTGGRSHYNYPQIRWSAGDAAAQALAEQFAAPCLLKKKAFSSTMRHAGMKANIPILIFEGGENLRFDLFSIEEGIAGIKRVLAAKGMAKFDVPQKKEILRYSSSRWQRAPRAGIFRWLCCSGNKVRKGDKIGVINDPYGLEETVITADRTSFIIGHNNSPVVSQGDALFHMAW